MTTAAEVRDRIRNTAPADWIQFNTLGVWTHQGDVALRLENEEQLESRFQAPWTQPLQGSCQSNGYVVYYGESPVEYHTVVSIDDYRAFVPKPSEPMGHNQPYTITPYQATLGRIITGDQQTFNAYLNRTGIEIRE